MAKENIENLTYEIIGMEMDVQVHVVNNADEIFKKTYSSKTPSVYNFIKIS